MNVKSAFAHITVPVDGSSTSERGVAFALELARGGGSVMFCSVVDPSLVCLPIAYGIAVDSGPMLTVLDDNAATFCRHAQAEATEKGIAAETRVLHGECVDAVASLVRQNSSQAIVVGTHGRTGFARNALGSVAEAFIRRSDVPVVAVHEDDIARTGPIAVALDESPAAHAALEIATRIALARGFSIVLIHADDTPNPNLPRMNALMTGAAKRVHARGVDVQIVLRNGHALDSLLSAADEHECCMIVMGTHGRPFYEKLLLGSVAAHVVQHAQIPVITVRRTTSVRDKRWQRASRAKRFPSFERKPHERIT